MARAFVIRPFNVKTDGAGNSIDFERVHTELIAPALDACRLAGSTTGEIVEPGNIREDMFSLIIEADIVICDFTIHNANVFYELGIRHALRKRRTVLIKGRPADATPFDVLTDRYVAYDANAPGESVDALVDTINAAMASERETDSPIFKMLPRLEEADVAKLQVVPLSLREEIDRALAAQSKGWLRLLAYDVRQRRFASAALLLIANALWRLDDHDAARDAYESIRDTSAFDPTANLALANIYERLYKRYRKPPLLTESDHAIARVLDSPKTEQKDRVEALALRGRNEKTRWREQFERLTTIEERRTAAMSEMLRSSFTGYADAFREDLNHFWSGLAALQMGVIFLDLTKEEGWSTTFPTDDDAVQFQKAMTRDVAALQVGVALSIDAGLKTLKKDDPNRVWANISKADHVFLTENVAARVINQYLAAVPAGHPFAWGAARGQLELFDSLGVRAALARQVIDAVNARNARVAPRPAPETSAADGKPAHVVMFAGHQFDEPNRPQARFPKTLEGAAYKAILESLRRFQQTDHVIGLASGSIGADILFHEACRELQVTSTLCLPIPTDQYVETTARDLSWRPRLGDLIKQKQALDPPALLELHKAPGVPAWLHGSGINEWERGNRWVLEMALTAGAPKVTLLVVWDEQETGELPGGTAHMVSLARARAGVEIVVIPTGSLESAGTTETRVNVLQR